MKTRSHIVVATAVALATGLSLNLIGSDARTTEEPLSAAPVSGAIFSRTFGWHHTDNPRIAESGLDHGKISLFKNVERQ